MLLLLDAGNSRCKWALLHDGAWLQRGAADNADEAALHRAFALLPAPVRILASNVAGETMRLRLCSACAQWGRKPEFVVARVEQCGVRNGYEQPQQLGSDRWAALIAAWHHVRDTCLVVNCGTATTVDALSAQGEFMGGLILPGISLMQRSLAANAAQLNSAEGTLRDFPRNTADALHSGGLRATLGAIRHQYELLQAQGATVHCLLGGGAATVLQPHLDPAVKRMDDLVLQGLYIMGEGRV